MKSYLKLGKKIGEGGQGQVFLGTYIINEKTGKTISSAVKLVPAISMDLQEIKLQSSKTYENPFIQIELDAIVTRPDGKELRVPGFWAGGDRWCFRYASGHAGKHAWYTVCTDKTNVRLHGAKGEIEVVKYEGDNPLYRHGPITVSKNQRYFEHVDGSPFFWLGDTWWKGLCKRLTWEGFRNSPPTAKRRASR